MAIGTHQGLSADINVTPMIDVLLVLLVIFILSAQLRRTLPVNVPPPAADPRTTTRSSPQVVLELKGDGSYAINGAAIAFSDLQMRLRELTEGGKRQLLFVRAAPKRRYREVVQAVDLARGAGWQIVGYMP